MDSVSDKTVTIFGRRFPEELVLRAKADLTGLGLPDDERMVAARLIHSGEWQSGEKETDT